MTVTLSELSELDLPIYPNSLVEDGEAAYFLARSGDEKRLCVMAPAGSMALGSFLRGRQRPGQTDAAGLPADPCERGRVARRAAVAAPGPVGAAHLGRLR